MNEKGQKQINRRSADKDRQHALSPDDRDGASQHFSRPVSLRWLGPVRTLAGHVTVRRRVTGTHGYTRVRAGTHGSVTAQRGRT